MVSMPTCSTEFESNAYQATEESKRFLNDCTFMQVVATTLSGRSCYSTQGIELPAQF
jgi:hypothetical protein